MQDFSQRLTQVAAATQSTLEALLDDSPRHGEIARPDRLMRAMRHAALGGGKRLRPFLLVESARLFGREDPGVLRAAAALECLHCYSLAHDDLPAMDDDALRRGQPTVHVAFDEATAILAGDALLTYAFDILADPLTDADPALRAELTLELARAAGPGGMAGGQMFDLQNEGKALDEPEIRRLQSMKTGALIRFAAWAGARMAGAEETELGRITRFGEIIGLAFQLADDLLDVEGDAATLGKAAGKDADRGKATLVALKGVDWTRATLRDLVDEADGLLADFGSRADILRQAARFVAERAS
ncbi:polyprenyl synthetase family protein [Breoghania sp. L-A4]|uniref:polyprenyl synthetase family protein n=1 Tax=Breoghania sp. L-A4 TaxID=2304600 RepID=UPI000E358427|nr:farnesyl diphosphate synthase [Breoghania sp. L-A4]AXS38853.1 polyprenyl synthetase family protein [Breoghania sp. L-A4]